MTLPRLRPRNIAALALGLVTVLTLVGCETGAYPLDIFPEMHYQASYRTQEPSHVGSPEGSIPTTGGEAPVTDFVAIIAKENPVPFTGESIDAARAVFETNCTMCHGINADGDSYVARQFEQYQEKAPPSLRRAELADQQDGALFWTITNGVNRMPSFKSLLTAEERWSLVNYIRSIQESPAPDAA